MNQNQKKAAVIAIVIFALIAIAAFAVVLIKDLSDNTITDQNQIIGTWTENQTGLEVTFSSNQVFSIMDAKAATYVLDEASQTITFTYAEAYGGQIVENQYQLSDNMLILTNPSTEEVQNYTKKQ